MSLEKFFKPIRLTDESIHKDYSIIQPFIDAAKAFAQATYQSVYIIDYYKRAFVYVSDNPLFLCGNKASTVQKMGYLFYYNYVPKEDLDLLLEINEAGFAFYNHLPVTERLDYRISYNFRLRQANKRLRLINHKLAPLLLDKFSNIWLALCIVSVPSNNHTGNIIIEKMNSDKSFQYDTQNKIWKQRSNVKLTNIESEIISLSSQGLTINDIACRLFVSVHTIKFHRREIFNKLRVKNMCEAISCAANYKIT